MTEFPQDINPQWLKVIRRLQSVARTRGFAIISISILVNEDGIPTLWTEPKQVKIEPRAATNDWIEILSDR
jgi:hypothetical protein